jgi:hypothetical protein
VLDLLLATCKIASQLRYDLIRQHCCVLTFAADDGRALNIDVALSSSETRRHVHDSSSNEDNAFEDVNCVPFVLRSSVYLYVGISCTVIHSLLTVIDTTSNPMRRVMFHIQCDAVPFP